MVAKVGEDLKNKGYEALVYLSATSKLRGLKMVSVKNIESLKCLYSKEGFNM